MHFAAIQLVTSMLPVILQTLVRAVPGQAASRACAKSAPASGFYVEARVRHAMDRSRLIFSCLGALGDTFAAHVDQLTRRGFASHVGDAPAQNSCDTVAREGELANLFVDLAESIVHWPTSAPWPFITKEAREDPEVP